MRCDGMGRLIWGLASLALNLAVWFASSSSRLICSILGAFRQSATCRLSGGFAMQSFFGGGLPSLVEPARSRHDDGAEHQGRICKAKPATRPREPVLLQSYERPQSVRIGGNHAHSRRQ